MYDTNIIDTCQAPFPALYIELIHQKWHWCYDWQWATAESHVQN